MDKFKMIKEQSLSVALEKNKTEIRNKLGTTKAKNFNLKNILGHTVSLSSLKGKVVLVDFWATWCAPCLAGFPFMQEMVNRYRNDTMVNFLFVNILEHTTFEKMKVNAIKLMRDNNYDFNVLLDTNEEIVADYKIEYIPLQIIIDKSGHIVFMGSDIENSAQLIDFLKNKPG